jgi:RNA polymerase sigma-70 factor, ECF subfamily
MSKNEHDESLVERAQASPSGDLRAFEGLVQRHQDMILANCRYMTGSADTAEDLAQEVFVKAYFALPRFEKRASFGTWVKRIKVNHCLNHIRKVKKSTFVDVDDPALQAESAMQVPATGAADLEALDERERIRRTLDQVPEKLRLPLILRDLDGLTYQEIAEHLHIGLSAVKMRIKRGREEFRRLYDPEGGSSAEENA